MTESDNGLRRISDILSERMRLEEVKIIAEWGDDSIGNKEYLWKMSMSDDRRTSVNSLWVMTHFNRNDADWLQSMQEKIIARLLTENDTAKKRIFLQLLREQGFRADNEWSIKLLNYCFSKINSECEPYAVRCLSLYVAYRLCRHYPELLSELQGYLNFLSSQRLSPGLKSAWRKINKNLNSSSKA